MPHYKIHSDDVAVYHIELYLTELYLLTHTGLGVSHWPRIHVAYLFPTRVYPSVQSNLIIRPLPLGRALPLSTRVTGHRGTERESRYHEPSFNDALIYGASSTPSAMQRSQRYRAKFFIVVNLFQSADGRN